MTRIAWLSGLFFSAILSVTLAVGQPASGAPRAFRTRFPHLM